MESLEELERRFLDLDESEEDIIKDSNDYQRLLVISSEYEKHIRIKTKKDSHDSKDEDFPNEIFNNIRWLYNEESSLRDVMLYIYGFRSETADKEEEAIRMLKTGDKLSKNNQEMVIKESECVGKRKERLEGLLMKYRTEFGMDEIREAIRLTMEWMQELETHLVSVVRYLLVLTPQDEEAKTEFQEFKSRLENIKGAKNGRVPICLYRILALLERHLRLMEESKFSIFCEMRKPPCKDIKTRERLEQNTGMMWSLEFVFRIISSLSFPENYEEEMLLYEAILELSNEVLEEIQMKINELLAVYLGWKNIRYGKNDSRIGSNWVVHQITPRVAYLQRFSV